MGRFARGAGLLGLFVVSRMFESDKAKHHRRVNRDRNRISTRTENLFHPINKVGHCFKCEGTGKLDLECRPCEGRGTHKKTCRGCEGSGRFTRPEKPCHTCHGTGAFHNPGDCRKCGGTGVFKAAIDQPCTRCDGRGTWKETCHACNGSGRFRPPCRKCDGSGWFKDGRNGWAVGGSLW